MYDMIHRILLGVVITRFFLVMLLVSGAASAAVTNVTTIQELKNPYAVSFKGLDGTDLEPLFKQLSDTYQYRAKPAPTMALMMMRVKGDAGRFQQVLNSRGYFNANIEIKVEGNDADKTLKIVYVFTLNAPFYFGTTEITVTNRVSETPVSLPSGADLGLSTNTVATYKRILGAQDTLLDAVRQQGYPFAKNASRDVVVDYAVRRVNTSFAVAPGPRTRFGSLEIIGLTNVEESIVTERIPWKQGDLFKPSLLLTFRERLDRTRLFSMAVLSNQQEVESDGEVDVKLQLQEAPRRSIGFGVGYNTEKGPGVAFNWENRNLLGRGETLHFELDVSRKNTQGELSYRIPEFFSKRIRFLAFTRLGHDEYRAYKSVYWKNSLGIEWRAYRQMRLGIAGVIKADRVEQFDETKNYLLQSIPVHLKLDFRDDPVEPVRGGAVFLEVEPFTELLNQYSFTRERFQYAQVLRILKKPQLVFSGNTRLGSIQGAGLFSVPATERFYAGGSDTVRGYPYQTVGPLIGDDPTGGLSLFTMNFELALKIFGPIALVGFLDGGTVFEEPTPDIHGDLLWGAGGGVRVYSPVGAIGVELGFPLNRRDIDDPYQFYITIGFQF
jgi:translocation and assembly module TamA